MPYQNRQMILDSYTDGLPAASNFRLETSEVGSCETDHIIVRNHYLSADPAQKGFMGTVPNYLRAELGEPMRSSAVGEIIESRLSGFEVGEFVSGSFGWQEYAHVDKKAVMRKVDPDLAPIQTALGVLGINGLTAYVALNRILEPKAGETILVTSAAGSVGSITGQLAKAMGCQVVGLTGSDDKASLCTSEYGYDVALNYRMDDLATALAEACPNGIDMFYDMVSGEIADTVFPMMNNRGRIAQIGTASVASWSPPPPAPRRERLILVKELRHQGCIVNNHRDMFPDALALLGSLVKSGELKFREHIFEGVESAPEALLSLYAGTNTGKTLIKLV